MAEGRREATDGERVGQEVGQDAQVDLASGVGLEARGGCTRLLEEEFITRELNCHYFKEELNSTLFTHT